MSPPYCLYRSGAFLGHEVEKGRQCSKIWQKHAVHLTFVWVERSGQDTEEAGHKLWENDRNELLQLTSQITQTFKTKQKIYKTMRNM